MGINLRLLLLFTLFVTSLWSSPIAEQLQANIQNESGTVKALYSMNNDKPLWIGHANNFHTFMKAIQTPYYNYKNKRFELDTIDQYTHLLRNDMDESQNSYELALLDIALTKSYIELANFIVQSDIDWDLVQAKLAGLKESKDIKANWEMIRKPLPSANQLFSALANQNINGFYKSLTPLPDRHADLINGLYKYQNFQNIVKLSYGEDLQYGDTNARIPDIKERLAASGDFPRQATYSDKFDDKLKEAMNLYKDRFNLDMNEKIDKVMIFYLNKPAEPLIESIITNLDKLKVFPDRFPSEVAIINIPDFNLDYYKNGYSVATMNTVVGRAERPTPLFSSEINSIVLNPTWTVPDNLVRRDLIKALKEDPNYMNEHNMLIYQGWENNSPIKNFDISKLLAYEDPKTGSIPYRVVQTPGDDNALGRVKFSFPNKYDVYLHDTDNKELLDRRYRIYSSGCMRLQNPFQFVDMIKDKFQNGAGSKIDQYVQSGKTITVALRNPLPIQTTYFTVFARNGHVYFRKDIYGYDKFIEESVKGSSTVSSNNILY